MTLDELAIKYGTDKSSAVHFYTRHYEKYFEPIRLEKLKILELGIQNGYSLKMWKEYFPFSEIYGLDVMNCAHMAEQRVHPIQGDQSDVTLLTSLSNHVEGFDIVIDDGSHKNRDQLVSFEVLFPLLKPGGIYVCEDLHVCYWGDTHDAGEPVFMDRMKALLDEVNSHGRSGKADIAKDHEDGEFLAGRNGPMTWYDKNVEYVHLYRHIVFIKRYDLYRA